MDALRKIWEGYRAHLIAGATVIILVFSFVVHAQAGQSYSVPVTINSETPTAELIVVDIEGAVVRPGLQRLPTGSLVEDAIAAAGGLTPDVDSAAFAQQLNRAEALKDHAKILVPRTGAASGTSAPGDGIINLNTATAEELDTLPGIGPATATKIIDYREANGPFGSVDDLLNVPGIGESKLAELRDRVTV